MTITQIKQIAKSNKYHLYVDGKWCGIFLDETLARHNLKTGMEVDEDFAEIKKENDEKLSFEMAISYMEKYVVSKKGIKDYLQKKGFDRQTISKTLDKLADYGYVNDEAFAKNYFESQSSGKGKRAIANKLLQKGISKEIVDELICNVPEEDEIEKAKLQAEKFVKNREKSPKTYQKCMAHLIYKGYDYSVAQQATQFALNEGENDDWI